MSLQDLQALQRLVQRMHTAPRTGGTILLCYRPQLYWNGRYHATGTKWEQCRWISDKHETGNEPHWEPWVGSPKVTSTLHIAEENCLGWMPLPAIPFNAADSKE